MILVSVDKNNINIAREIQLSLFPTTDAYINYLESVEGITDNEYWLLSVNGEYVGISGIYSLAIDPSSAWLGWFGIIPRFQRQGFGRQAIMLYEERARQMGFKYARLYTGRFDNEIAKTFYEHNGYKEEYYNCPEDPGCEVEPLSIYSKCLFDNEEVTLWGNKNLDIAGQIVKQRNAAEAYITNNPLISMKAKSVILLYFIENQRFAHKLGAMLSEEGISVQYQERSASVKTVMAWNLTENHEAILKFWEEDVRPQITGFLNLGTIVFVDATKSTESDYLKALCASIKSWIGESSIVIEESPAVDEKSVITDILARI